jgi:hypothetical protein
MKRIVRSPCSSYTWPLEFTSTDDEDDGLRSLLAPGEERFSVL